MDPSLKETFNMCPPGPMLRLRSSNRAVDLSKSLLSLEDMMSCPSCLQVMAFLHTATCACKCKTYLIPIHPLSIDNLIYLDSIPFGAKIISPFCYYVRT